MTANLVTLDGVSRTYPGGVTALSAVSLRVGNLDTATGTAVMALLRDLSAAGTTVVVITHDRDLAAQLPRRVRMRDGEVVADTQTPVDQAEEGGA